VRSRRPAVDRHSEDAEGGLRTIRRRGPSVAREDRIEVVELRAIGGEDLTHGRDDCAERGRGYSPGRGRYSAADGVGRETGVARLGVLLAMAMFVFVIDTSLMNVSISAVVRDLDTTVSGVQSAVALEALVSAAFILIGSKFGDLFGRKRAYVLGLVLYASGALAMVFAQGLAAIIVFWAVIGGLGAALYLPAMQSLIHGNFQGDAQAKVFALIGASAAIAAAIGPLLGGF
jgi:Major Facilitator Superfamily